MGASYAANTALCMHSFDLNIGEASALGRLETDMCAMQQTSMDLFCLGFVNTPRPHSLDDIPCPGGNRTLLQVGITHGGLDVRVS